MDMMAGTGMEVGCLFHLMPEKVYARLSDANPQAIAFLTRRFVDIFRGKTGNPFYDRNKELIDKFNVHTNIQHPETSFLDMVYSNNVSEKSLPNFDIMILDPMWPGGADYRNPIHRYNTYFVDENSANRKSLVDVIKHVSQSKSEFLAIVVKVARFFLEKRGLRNNGFQATTYHHPLVTEAMNTAVGGQQESQKTVRRVWEGETGWIRGTNLKWRALVPGQSTVSPGLRNVFNWEDLDTYESYKGNIRYIVIQ